MTKKEREDRSHVFTEIENLDNPNHVRVRSFPTRRKSPVKSQPASPKNWKLKLRASSDSRGQQALNKLIRARLEPIQAGVDKNGPILKVPTLNTDRFLRQKISPRIDLITPSNYRSNNMIPVKNKENSKPLTSQMKLPKLHEYQSMGSVRESANALPEHQSLLSVSHS